MAKLVSQVYGDALMEESLSRQDIDETYEEICALREIWLSSPDLIRILESPKIVKEEKLEAIKEIFSKKASDEVVGFLMAVVEKSRQADLVAIFDYFIDKVKEYKHIGVAYVTSALELKDSEKKAIESKLLETTQYTSFEMHYDTDAELIGGMTIRIKDRVIDSSVKTRIYNIKKDLLDIQLV